MAFSTFYSIRAALIGVLLVPALAIPGVGQEGMPQAGSIVATESPQISEVKPEDRCSVEGSVVNAISGRAIEGARVAFRQIDGATRDQKTPEMVSDSLGKFKLTNIEPGRYLVSAARNGFAVAISGSPKLEATFLSLTPKQSVKDVVLHLYPASTISGKALDGNGEPVRRILILAVRFLYINAGQPRMMPAALAQTDDKGEFRLCCLRSGLYYVAAVPMGQASGSGPERGEALTPSYYPGVPSVKEASAVALRESEDREAVDFRLRPSRAFRLEVRAMDGRTGQLLSKATLTLSSPEGILTARPIVTGDGAFRFEALTPGAYVLTAVSRDGKTLLSARTPIEISNKAMNLEVMLNPAGDVTGVARIEGECPPVAFDKMLTGRYPLDAGHTKSTENSVVADVDSVRMGADGAFTFQQVPDGEYGIYIADPPANCYLKSARQLGIDVLERGFSVIHGAAQGRIELLISCKAATITGSVLDAKDQRTRAQVALIPEPEHRARPDLWKTAFADASGQFAFASVAPGSYRLYAWDQVEPGADRDPEFLDLHKDRSRAVTIKEGDRETLVLHLPTAAR